MSLFIDPDPAQIEAAVQIGAPVVELHTGAYADARGAQQAPRAGSASTRAARHASSLGLKCMPVTA